MSFFKQLLETNKGHAGPITHEIADAICFMLRVLHFFVEYASSEGGFDLAGDGVGLVSLLIRFAIVSAIYHLDFN
jgi:hypothetical protein